MSTPFEAMVKLKHFSINSNSALTQNGLKVASYSSAVNTSRSRQQKVTKSQPRGTSGWWISAVTLTRCCMTTLSFWRSALSVPLQWAISAAGRTTKRGRVWTPLCHCTHSVLEEGRVEVLVKSVFKLHIRPLPLDLRLETSKDFNKRTNHRIELLNEHKGQTKVGRRSGPYSQNKTWGFLCLV